MAEAKAIIRRVRKIEIKTRRAVESLMQGAYHSVFKGRGIEFSDVREYIPGDDVRAIDWNITARMNSPYVKEFIEERNLVIYILLDVSSSSQFGSERPKKDSAIELAATIMLAAMRNNDRVGLVLFADDIELFIPARTGRKHALKCISDMIGHSAIGKATGMGGVLARFARIVRKRSIVFILSDFICENYERQLSMLRIRHDVIAVNLRDIREEEIPDIGFIELEDAETEEQMLINTSAESFRRGYAELVRRKNDSLSKMFKQAKIDMVQLRSGEDFIIPIRRFFAMRERRQAR